MTGKVGSTVLQPWCEGNTVADSSKSKKAVSVPLGPMVVEAGVLESDGRVDLGTVFIAAAVAPMFILMMDSVVIHGEVIVLVEDEAKWFADLLNTSFQWTAVASWEDFWLQVKACTGPKVILGQARWSKSSVYEARFLAELVGVALGEEDGVMLISSLRRVRHLLPNLKNHHLAVTRVKHSSIGGITTNSYQIIASSSLLSRDASVVKSTITRSLGSVTGLG